MAAVAGVLTVLLAVAYFVYFPNNKPGPVGSFSKDEKAAVTAAGTVSVNLATYSRASFEKDFVRALGGTTGKLRTEVQGEKALTKKTITDNKFDLFAKVRHAALLGPAEAGKGDSYVVLVVLFGYQSTARTVPNPQNLQVTVTKVKGRWLANDVSLVTIQ